MGDQGRWWKLWCSALDDDDLDNLPIADFGRYCKLGAHIKEHGCSGTITLKPPVKTLLSTLQLVTFDELIAFVSTLPNVRVTSTLQPTVTLTVTYNNWNKFQQDSSAERVRKWREKQKACNNVTVTTREEKRREEKVLKKESTKNLAEDSAPAKKKSPTGEGRPEANSSVKPLIDHYHASFVARFKSPPPLNGAKCGAIAKKLLAGRTLDEAKWLVTEHLSNPPDFYEGKNLYGLEHVLASAQTLLARRAKAKGEAQ